MGFNCSYAIIVVTIGIGIYDENNKLTKSRTLTKQYIPNKLARYAMQF